MKFYLIYKKKNNKFYAWTDDDKTILQFMKYNDDNYYCIITDNLPDDSIEEHELYDYYLEQYFLSSDDHPPLILRTDEFALFETLLQESIMKLYHSSAFILLCVNSYRISNDEKRIMKYALCEVNSDVTEVINDDEPVYEDVIDISTFYRHVVETDSKKFPIKFRKK